MDPMEMRKQVFEAYAESINQKSLLGLPMPKWEDLPDEVKRAWGKVIQKVINLFVEGFNQWDGKIE